MFWPGYFYVRPLMKSFIALVAASVCIPAVADQFYLTAHMECNSSKPELVVSFRGSWNEKGEAIIANLGPKEVDPRKLIAISQDRAGKYSISTKVDSKVCRMGRQDHTVEFSPFLAPRFQPEGHCAKRIGAKAVVKLQGKALATASIDACTEEGNVTKSISLSPERKPVYDEVNAKQFYGT